MTIGIFHDDEEIFVKLTTEEFIEIINDGIKNNKDGKQIIQDCIKELKQRTLTA